MLKKFKREINLVKNKDTQIQNLDENFVKVLDENEFRNCFDIDKEWNIDELSNRTVDFIRNKNIEGSSTLKELSLVLKEYNIPITSYFNFLENINGLKFGNDDCKVIIADEYKRFAEEVDKYNVDDVLKLEAKINQFNKVIEAEKANSSNEMIGKVMLSIVSSTTIIVFILAGKDVAKEFF